MLSLLVVFLNNSISFDEVEKHVYNTVIEEELNDVKLKKSAGMFISKALLLYYLRRKRAAKTNLYRFYLILELIYISRNFKIMRLYFLHKKKPIEKSRIGYRQYTRKH